jgi:hypothetical protein
VIPNIIFFLILVAAIVASVILVVSHPVKLLARIQLILMILVVTPIVISLPVAVWLAAVADPVRRLWTPRLMAIDCIVFPATFIPSFLFTIFHVIVVIKRRLDFFGPLGHIMPAAYFIRLTLILGWQASMTAAIFYFSHSPVWVMHTFVVSGSLLPFIGYFFSFYDAPVFAIGSRITKPIVLTLLFIVFTVVGFWFLLFLMFGLFMAFGGHHW